MWRCEKCSEFRFNDVRQCNCTEFTVIADGEEYSQHAMSAEQAAMKFGEKYNTNNDYCLMNDSIVVEVKDGEESKFFSVSAEPDIHYSCNEVEEPNVQAQARTEDAEGGCSESPGAKG